MELGISAVTKPIGYFRTKQICGPNKIIALFATGIIDLLSTAKPAGALSRSGLVLLFASFRFKHASTPHPTGAASNDPTGAHKMGGSAWLAHPPNAGR